MEEYQSSVRQYNNVHSRMMTMQKELYRIENVIDELQVQPKEIYVSLGKAFVLSDYETLKKDIKEKRDNLENDIKKLEPMDASLAQKVNDAQERLIKSMKAQQK
ncbi:hypothetical protein EHI8A_022280 [Entamoeba histolytica HM-1:IMSS-B]|uniref:Prefoldin subunit n=6 Tax=Entamoeba histolytica TaxID=5759 RepID=C4LWV2_ENTH1|nr:hypothetical protein EHI_199060 [Entamoeba histolytica HM-1:IMSS]EMD43542.1 Hypothetical protein EHI5A_045800 [Entamoeba histolytica KU27]EMH74657.1 hypothetical protein EHI8A_022280 [Entamoeba histolytica HM-1:IMSS-B]EMS16253.1 hypothetical protein KM1_024720 [Entamoeba histolytica HM-3:IMSS]ENY63201.1 hypothetical protein EHI7A_025090 [Entamoeba histolytica HM-1:IMSS-A]GAT93195.1 hypothetical protein CL6EHI_199060 [Entamoeba histolytica]|eukprot:XP_653289.1 hypothetical protein EHI_199060 [Entamoeba histolytica HM-1:IMSS]